MEAQLSDLFTIMMEYHGGTYISQVRASDLSSVLTLWGENLRDQDLKDWKLTRSDVERVIARTPILLDSLESAWCATETAKRGLILVNIVKTVSSP